MATAIDAKGDLVGGTGADAFARLAVGANGTVLTADSVETTGLKWATPATPSYTWTTWTPSYTNLTLGNGTEVAEYLVIGDLVHVRYLLTWGSTTSITGNVSISLPVTASTSIDDPDIGGGLMGNAMLFDTSAVKPILGTPFQISSTQFRITPNIETGSYVNGGGVMQATTPFTWATTDNVQATFWYRKA
jgi:hypothetical protein